MIRRHAHGTMTLRRDGKEIAGGVAVLRLLRRPDGVLRAEVTDDIADGLLCRVAAEIEADEVERILAGARRGESSVHCAGILTISVVDDVSTGRGTIDAHLETVETRPPADATARVVRACLSLGDLVVEATAEHAELICAVVDLLPLSERPPRRPQSPGTGTGPGVD